MDLTDYWCFFSKTDNIKDVIAFPKTQSAACPLSEAPTKVDQSALDVLQISIGGESNDDND